ncbi:MAG: L,D-transpeptidase family protein [Eubacteriales bacterium]|nr:L,D-transpeptidase family protein [Eubacteriales bacterium]
MITSFIAGLAAACFLMVLPGTFTQEMQEKVIYNARVQLFNPFEKNGIYENMRIVYRTDKENVILEAEDVVDWVRYWPDGHWDIDDDRIAEFVASLQKKFDTWDYYKILDTTPGETEQSKEVQIPPGEYGWRVDRNKEVKEISTLLRRNGTTVHDIHFSSTAVGWDDPRRDYGDSYVEIDLTRQHLWLYIDGEIKVSTDIVSGLMNTERQTPGGAYAIYYKQSPAVLRGADYESPVSYWMPFNGGIGLHDATWQWSFGGDACYYRGSHGCINLPLDAAEAIYGLVEKGFPVLCYY